LREKLKEKLILINDISLEFIRRILRVTSKQWLKILIVDGDGENIDTTLNVVYHEVFLNVSWWLKFKLFFYVCYHFILLLFVVVEGNIFLNFIKTSINYICYIVVTYSFNFFSVENTGSKI